MNNIADWIVKNIRPKRVLDVGCGKGFLVKALRDRGVEAYGIDISEYILDPFPHNHYDLIVCIEVLEHLPEEHAKKAIENLCRHADDIIFSSNPNDFKEPTHLNVQPMDYWIKLFSQFGFYRDSFFDGSFISPWCMRFRKRLNGEDVKITYLSADAIAKGSCGMIRIFSPLQQCMKQYNVSVKPCLIFDKTSGNLFLDAKAIEESNIIILHRADVIILNQRKEFWNKIFNSPDKKVIYDMDDLLLDLPSYNPGYAPYNKIKPYIIEIMNRADLITVTTWELKKAIEERIPEVRNKIVVLPNFIDISIWKKKDISPRKGKPKFLFAGTPTHCKDLEMIEDAIKYILRKYAGKVEFEIWGEERISKDLAQYSKKKFTDYIKYANDLSRSDFDFALVPLIDNQFNRCKSNIKWLEYGICGIPAIFSDLPPYSCVKNGLTGVLVDNDLKSWIDAMEMLLKNPDWINFMARKVQEEVLENYTIQKNAFRWFDVFCSLLDKREKESQSLTFELRKDSKAKVGIVVLNYNGAKDTIECLESIYKNTDYERFQVILVDNASKKEDIELIEKWKKETGYDFLFIKNPENLGFAGGVNVGIKKALEEGADYVWLLNNDTVVEKDTLKNLLLAFDQPYNIGMVSSKIYSYFDRSKVQFNGERIYYSGIPDKGNDKPAFVDFAPACSVLISKEVFEKIGFFNEDYFLYYEDNDFCERLKNAGFQILYNPFSKVYHKGGASIGSWLKSPISAYYGSRNLLFYFAGDESEEKLISCFLYMEKFYWDDLEKEPGCIKGFVEGVKDYILRKKGKVNPEQLNPFFWKDWPDKELENKAKKLVNFINKDKFVEFLSVAKEILLKDKKNKAYELCKKGEEEYEKGNIDKAIFLFEEAIKLDNTCHIAYNDLAAIYWQMGNKALASCFIEKAAELAPDDPDVRWNYEQIKKVANG